MNKLKINFGSSYNTPKGWINIDNSLRHILISKMPFLHNLLFCIGFLSKSMYLAHKQKKFEGVIFGDVRKRLKFITESVDFIYSSHMLEHLYPKEAQHFLRECHRILKKEGIIRLALPDIEEICKGYSRKINKYKDSKFTQEFNMKIYASTCTREKFGHHWMFDFFLIRDFLHNAGFKKIKKCKYQKGSCPDLNLIENHKDSLFVEAKK